MCPLLIILSLRITSEPTNPIHASSFGEKFSPFSSQNVIFLAPVNMAKPICSQGNSETGLKLEVFLSLKNKFSFFVFFNEKKIMSFIKLTRREIF